MKILMKKSKGIGFSSYCCYQWTAVCVEGCIFRANASHGLKDADHHFWPETCMSSQDMRLPSSYKGHLRRQKLCLFGECCAVCDLVSCCEATTTADQLTSGGVRSSPSKLVQRNVMSLVFSSGVGFSYGVWWDPKNRKTQFCGKTNLIWTMLKILCISHQPTIPFLFFPMFGIITISRTCFQWNCP